MRGAMTPSLTSWVTILARKKVTNKTLQVKDHILNTLAAHSTKKITLPKKSITLQNRFFLFNLFS